MDARGHRIVIVEEPSLSRNVLAKALRVWGWDVRLVDSERAALAAAHGASVMTVLLVDWFVDCVDCEELCRAIRQAPALGHVYVMVAIPRDAAGAIRRSVLAGAHDCVRRPYDLDEFRLRLDIAAKLLGVTAPSGG